MNNSELAKELVVAFIRAGKINSVQQAVDNYLAICAMLNKNADAEPLPVQEEPYSPFKGL